MYAPLNTKSGSVQTGAAYAATVAGSYTFSQTPDGLAVDTSNAIVSGKAVMPERLNKWLLELRLLCHVPLSYLVADAALLPAESIRFFHVDLTWVDRIIDGVFSAANTGTVDITYSVAMLQIVRQMLDDQLKELADASVANSGWTAANGMTGMLIRSELVRRWPDVIVTAFTGTDEKSPGVPVLRAEPISKDVYIAIFAGTPQLVQLREPHVGVRFGVEYDEPTKKYEFLPRDTSDGHLLNPANPAPTVLTLGPGRMIPLASIGNTPRSVAIQLMRQPFIQQFMNSVVINNQKTVVPESRGSQDPPASVTGKNGRVYNMQALITRLDQLQRMGKS